MGFPGSSAGKEYACNAGDLGLIPGSGRFPGEGIGYPLQYSWASLVGQMVKNVPAMQETWIRSLGWEDPLEEGKATHSSILAWRILMDRGAWCPWGHKELDTTEQPDFFTFIFYDPMDVGNFFSCSSAFSKSSLNIWKFLVLVMLKPSL